MGTGFAAPFGEVVVKYYTERFESDLKTYDKPEKLAYEIVKSGKMKKRIVPLLLALYLVDRGYDSIIRPRQIRNYSNQVLKPSWFEKDLKVKGDTSVDHPVDIDYMDVTRVSSNLCNSNAWQREIGEESLVEAERKAGLRRPGRKIEAHAVQDGGGPRVYYNPTWQTMLVRQVLSDPDVKTLVYYTLKQNGLLLRYFSLIYDAMFIVITKFDFENLESLFRRVNQIANAKIEWQKTREFFKGLDAEELTRLKHIVVILMVENPNCINFSLHSFAP